MPIQNRLFLLCALAPAIFAHPSKIASIDAGCLAIQSEFREALPRVFSGPDPWTELDRVPAAIPDVALASVYSEGSRIRRVILRMEGPSQRWYQSTDYCFGEDGFLRKRERLLEQADANVMVEEITYYQAKRSIKTVFKHHPLTAGRENWDDYFDPHAPDYFRTEDLPFPLTEKEWNNLARTLDLPSLLYPAYQ
jgi:hypothetical protein